MTLNFCASCGSQDSLHDRTIHPSVTITLCHTCDFHVTQPVDAEQYYIGICPVVTAIMEQLWQIVETPLLYNITARLNETSWQPPRGGRWTTSSTFKLLQRLGIERSRQHIFERSRSPLPISQVDDAFPINTDPQDYDYSKVDHLLP